MKLEDTLIFYNWMPSISDWVVDYPDEYYKLCGVSSIHNKPYLNKDNISLISEGDIIFVKTDFLRDNRFQQNILPLINVPFILVSGVSSHNVDNYKPILESDKVTKWYCTNPPCEHEKIIGLPIGFEEKERDGGDQEVLQSFLSRDIEKKDKILLPYHTKSTNPSRNKSTEYLQSLSFVDVQEDKLPFSDYLNLLSQYKYCICLEGAGFDTHRNYECLLTGTVPIMKKSGVELIYEDYNLPSRFLEDWNEIDDSFYEELKNTDFDFSGVEKFLQTKTHIERIKND